MEREWQANKILIVLSNLLQFCIDYIDHAPNIFLFIRLYAVIHLVIEMYKLYNNYIIIL